MITFNCDICKKEILLRPDSETDMIEIATLGKEYRCIGTRNKIMRVRRVFHVHKSVCFPKFLGFIEKKKK